MPTTTATYEGVVHVCAHRVSFYFETGQELTAEMQELLNEEAEDRAQKCIAEGYVSGELCYEDDNVRFDGWWKIED